MMFDPDYVPCILRQGAERVTPIANFSFLLDTVGTAESVALAFLCQVLPQTLVSPAAGVINDRLRRRKVMLFADWSRFAIVACMLLVRGRDIVWLLYTLLVLKTI